MSNRRVLVCCGTGIATSVQVSNKLKEMLKARGIQADVAECKAMELPSRISAFRPHAVVSTTQVNADALGIAVHPGLPFLTGIGAEEAADAIAEQLRAVEDPS